MVIIIILFLLGMLISGCSKPSENLYCQNECCKPAEHCIGNYDIFLDKNGCLNEPAKKRIEIYGCNI